MTTYNYEAIAKHLDSEGYLIGFTLLNTHFSTIFWDTVSTKKELENGVEIINLSLNDDGDIVISEIVKEIYEDKTIYEMLEEMYDEYDSDREQLEPEVFLPDLKIKPISKDLPGVKIRFSSLIKTLAVDSQINNLFICGNSENIENEIKNKTAKAKMIGLKCNEQDLSFRFHEYRIGNEMYIIDTTGELVIGDIQNFIVSCEINRITFRNCIADKFSKFHNMLFQSTCNYIDMSTLDLSDSDIENSFDYLIAKEVKLGNFKISNNTSYLFYCSYIKSLKIQSLSIDPNCAKYAKTFFKATIDELIIDDNNNITGKDYREVFSKCYIGKSNTPLIKKWSMGIDLDGQGMSNEKSLKFIKRYIINKDDYKTTRRANLRLKMLVDFNNDDFRENADEGISFTTVAKYIKLPSLREFISTVYKPGIEPLAVTFNLSNNKIMIYTSDNITLNLTLTSKSTGLDYYKLNKNNDNIPDIVQSYYIHDIIITKSIQFSNQIILAIGDGVDIELLYNKQSEQYNLFNGVSAGFLS